MYKLKLSTLFIFYHRCTGQVTVFILYVFEYFFSTKSLRHTQVNYFFETTKKKKYIEKTNFLVVHKRFFVRCTKTIRRIEKNKNAFFFQRTPGFFFSTGATGAPLTSPCTRSGPSVLTQGHT